MTDKTEATYREPAEAMSTDDELHIQQQLFEYVHAVERRFGLPGVRLIKRWCLEKLPFKAFSRGYFDA